MNQKSNCINCDILVPDFLYEVNSGYCMKCYKNEIRNDAYKIARLSEKESIEIAEKYLNNEYKAEKSVFDVYYQNGSSVLGKWSVFFKHKYNLPEGVIMEGLDENFVVIVEDATGIALERN